MTAALKIKGLAKTYGNGFEALKGIDLEIAQGDFFALLGPNGAGKSTIIGIISSLITKSAGKVWICGVDIDKDFPKAKRSLGLVPQELNFHIFEKVEDILISQAGYYGIPYKLAKGRVEYYLRSLGLEEKRNVSVRMLSGGMKRRLMLARALIHEPKLLVLDEPTAGVDIEMRRSMYDFLWKINRSGTTIILTTHYLEEAENLCRNIAIINQGEIVTNNSVRDLLRNQNQESFVLDCRGILPEKINVEGFSVNRVDDYSLKINVEKGQDLSIVFEALKQQGIIVVSMRNEANRLEQIFLDVLEGPA